VLSDVEALNIGGVVALEREANNRESFRKLTSAYKANDVKLKSCSWAATWCAALQHAGLCCNMRCRVAACGAALQHVVLCCSTVCCVAAWCAELQPAVVFAAW
jgi:hypothetical protein